MFNSVEILNALFLCHWQLIWFVSLLGPKFAKYMHMHMHMHIGICIYAYAYMHMHMHMHIRICIHMANKCMHMIPNIT